MKFKEGTTSEPSLSSCCQMMELAFNRCSVFTEEMNIFNISSKYNRGLAKGELTSALIARKNFMEEGLEFTVEEKCK